MDLQTGSRTKQDWLNKSNFDPKNICQAIKVPYKFSEAAVLQNRGS